MSLKLGWLCCLFFLLFTYQAYFTMESLILAQDERWLQA